MPFKKDSEANVFTILISFPFYFLLSKHKFVLLIRALYADNKSGSYVVDVDLYFVFLLFFLTFKLIVVRFTDMVSLCLLITHSVKPFEQPQNVIPVILKSLNGYLKNIIHHLYFVSSKV